MNPSGVCINCDGPITQTRADGVWRHQAKTHEGRPMLTRWCVHGGWYIWPTQHADPGEPVVVKNDFLDF